MEFDSMDTNHFLNKYKPLVYKILHRLNIKKSHMDYDDYLQELLIHLLKIKEKFIVTEEDADEETKSSMFLAYAEKGLYWHGINRIRKNQNKVFNCMDDEDIEWLSHKQTLTSSHVQTNAHLEDFFDQAKKRLSKEDYLLLVCLSDDRYTTKEIADLMQISLSTLYYRKDIIKCRLEGIKDCLKD